MENRQKTKKSDHMSEKIRVNILQMYSKGLSQAKIARIVKCSRCCVQTTLKRFEETGSNQERPGRGRKRITNERTDRELVRLSLRDRRKTSLDLTAELNSDLGTQLSAQTVRRRLKENGLGGRKARKKPWLSAKHVEVRLKFAKNHQNWTASDWENIIWSDESNFEIFGTSGVTYVRRRPGEEYNPECLVKTVKFGGGSIMVWGCMSADGVGKMVLCEGRMDSKKYIATLNEALLPSFPILFGDTNMDNVVFQQDNAPCHKSAAVMKWFEDNSVPTLDWPAQSPDLNPIEHLWAILKQNIRRHQITSKESLYSALREEWSKIDPKICKTLVHSMCDRVREVLLRNGGTTKY